MMLVCDDEIDFDAYLKGPAENPHVKPASDWLEAMIESFHRPVHLTGAALPWHKTETTVRLRHGELTIWPGMNGHGKSMLVGQVALALMAQGEKVCIASMEMKPQDTMKRMARQAFASNQPIDRDLRDFGAWTNGKLWLYDQQGQVSAERILAVGRYCHEALGINHLIVDNLLSCGLAEDDYTGQKMFALALATHAHDTRQSVHLLAHSRKTANEMSPPGKYDVRGSASITDLADNVFTVWRNKAKEKDHDDGKFTPDEPDCLLIVDKHRHGEWEGRIQLWFDKPSQSYVSHPEERPKAMKLMAENDTVEF